jgi:dienelactone hydrolase
MFSDWLVGLAMIAAPSIEAASPQATTEAPSGGQRMIENYLRHEAMRLDAKFLEGVHSKEDWERLRPALREQYLEMLGLWPLPERTPLEAKITGTVDRSQDGFRIEKLHFQSRPHLYVTGNLYLPAKMKSGERLPAVLYVCGHSGRGRDGNKAAFQHHGMWFATHGYVCLIIDTLQLGEIAGIHHGSYRYDRWWWHARGYTPAGVECWNGMRAIDYLESRPEVDASKIAVTGISGGGAATFWIAAADERVKVAVPVSGMSDLEDYVANKVVNGHCDCMFMNNTHQWPWTHIAALVAPRPMLFENSGHDPIFPMPSNDRIRARLEALYRLYTDKPAQLFDIGVTPGGHEDNPELRLMAYRWINKHLKGDNNPVTEPPLEPEKGENLRVFPGALPADEINTRIDESFVPVAEVPLPRDAHEFQSWREQTIERLRRLCFSGHPRGYHTDPALGWNLGGKDRLKGWLATDMQMAELDDPWRSTRMACVWDYEPAKNHSNTCWIIALNPHESLSETPDWAKSIVGGDAVLRLASRGCGPLSWEDKAPYYIQRSMALLGRTVDSGRVADVAAFTEYTHNVGSNSNWKIMGHGEAGIIAAYAAVLAPEHCLSEVVVVDPPKSHREGPIFLNVLRVLDIPDALGLLAPRQLTIHTKEPAAFQRTAEMFRAAGGRVKVANTTQQPPGSSATTALFAGSGFPSDWSVRMWNDVSKPAATDAVWQVKDGTLTGSAQRGTWLVSDAEFGDFEIEFEFKLGERGNSGFGFRFPPAGDPAFDGFELQMADLRYNTSAKPSELTGGLYRALAPRVQVYKPTEWNKYHIHCVGRRIQVVLNDERILDVNLDEQNETVKRHDGTDAPALCDRPRRGHIGFQELSRDGAQVQIRNVRLKALN